MSSSHNQAASFAEGRNASFPALDSPVFVPDRYRPGGLRTWSGHLPFARDLIASLRPGLLVELGTHYGESYFGFCQSVVETELACRCYAVDTWLGDPHAGEYGGEVYEDVERYNRKRYSGFSYLLRTTFDDALSKFSDETIDLLHIDGLHTYAAVLHDWENWLPKVATGGIILLHDTVVRHVDFGVWRLWERISKEFDSFEFHHCYGLGVIRKGGRHADDHGILGHLFDPASAESIRRHYVSCAQRLDLIADLSAAQECLREPTCQVYYPQHGAFSELSSSTARLRTGAWQKITMELPAGLDGPMLRLDPVDRPAVVDIGSLALFHAFDRRELYRYRPGQPDDSVSVGGTAVQIPADSYLRIFAYGPDPSVTFSVPARVPQQEPVIIECWIRLHADFSILADHLAGHTVPCQNGQARPDNLPEPEQPAAQTARNRELFVDPPHDILIDTPVSEPTASSYNFVDISLTGAALRNDWGPADGEPDTWVCSTPDPWVVFEIADVSKARWFGVRMSCTVDAPEAQAQLFWHTTDSAHFEERYSVRFTVIPDGKMHTYLIDLLAGGQITSAWSRAARLIRFDPLDTPGRFCILRAGFAQHDGADLEQSLLAS